MTDQTSGSQAAPEGTAAPETANDEALNTGAEQNQNDETTDSSEAADAPEAEASAEGGEQPAVEAAASEQPQTQPKGIDKRINELTRARHVADRAALAEKTRADNLERQLADALAATASAPEGDGAAAAPVARTTSGMVPASEVARLAQVEAQKIAATTVFNTALQNTVAEGNKTFGGQEFTESCNTLADLGANDRRDFLETVTDMPNGSQVMHHLGQDVAEAARVLALPPLKMARELERISQTLTKAPAPKPVSKAPAPAAEIRGSSGSDTELRDDLPMAEWTRRFDARMAARKSAH